MHLSKNSFGLLLISFVFYIRNSLESAIPYIKWHATCCEVKDCTICWQHLPLQDHQVLTGYLCITKWYQLTHQMGKVVVNGVPPW